MNIGNMGRMACPKQSATGHIEFIGTVAGVNLGRHIIYSFSAVQPGHVDAYGNCVVMASSRSSSTTPILAAT
jgi:hypothetical protein